MVISILKKVEFNDIVLQLQYVELIVIQNHTFGH